MSLSRCDRAASRPQRGWWSDRIPGIDVTGPFEGCEAVLHRRQPVFRQLFRGPTVRAGHDADWAGLVVKVDLVTADAEDLAGDAGRGIGAEEGDQLGDVVRAGLG